MLLLNRVKNSSTKQLLIAGSRAAYEEAKAIVDSLKTADELKAAKEAVEKQIAALPYTAKLTVAVKAAVKAAYEAYDAYMKMPGAFRYRFCKQNFTERKIQQSK